MKQYTWIGFILEPFIAWIVQYSITAYGYITATPLWSLGWCISSLASAAAVGTHRNPSHPHLTSTSLLPICPSWSH
jgi:hypothetical protein